MRNSVIPQAVRSLLWQHLSTVDHVAVLLALRASDNGLNVQDVEQRATITPEIADAVLRDLEDAGLARREADRYVYAPADAVRPVVDQLQQMYDTRPVTLVRTIYERPSSAAQIFADAFRLRKPGD